MALVYMFASSKMEARPIEAVTRNRPSADDPQSSPLADGGNRVAVIVTGMGPKYARIKADVILATGQGAEAGRPPKVRRPDAILVIGVCGGLTELLPEQRIVAYNECLSATKSPPVRCSPTLTSSIIETLRSRGIACDPVVGISSPTIASTKGEKMALASTGASVVDMESYEILFAAERAGTPAAVLRVVSDSLSRSMPHFNRAVDDQGGVHMYQALWIALGSPLRTVGLITSTKRAINRLAPAVKLVLQSNCFTAGARPLNK
jgi:purine-nucleoside phosphorylase